MKLVIIGAGGHAKVVTDTAQIAGWQVVGFADDSSSATLFDLPYLGTPKSLDLSTDTFAVIAIGSNQIREKISKELSSHLKWATVIHPRAIVSGHTKLEAGTVIFAGAVIQPDVFIGQHCIINTSASIDHDCQISDFCHVAPNVTLTGGVILETGSFVGAGSVIIPGRKVGAWSTLGAGSVCVQDLGSNGRFAGTPAKPIKAS